MCYAGSCNPSCGKCRPRRIVEVCCPRCGSANSLTREEYLIGFDLPHRMSIPEKKMLEKGTVKAPVCASCTADLSEVYRNAVPPRNCHLQNVLCGFPCGRSSEPFDPKAPKCQTMVPLGKMTPEGDEQEDGPSEG